MSHMNRSHCQGCSRLRRLVISSLIPCWFPTRPNFQWYVSQFANNLDMMELASSLVILCILRTIILIFKVRLPRVWVQERRYFVKNKTIAWWNDNHVQVSRNVGIKSSMNINISHHPSTSMEHYKGRHQIRLLSWFWSPDMYRKVIIFN